MDRRSGDVDGRIGGDELLQTKFQGFVGGKEGARGGNGDGYHGAHALVKATKQGPLRGAIGIFVQLPIVRRLYSRF